MQFGIPEERFALQLAIGCPPLQPLQPNLLGFAVGGKD
jgi:hypothetical protein